MAVFNSYVSLPEGNWNDEMTDAGDGGQVSGLLLDAPWSTRRRL